jgi:hypothetical protein
MQRRLRSRRCLLIPTRKGETTMLKTSTIAACVFALSSGVALAQMVPAGPNAAPGGASGSTPPNTIGSPTANAQDTLNGGTRSTTVLSHSNKNQSAAGMPRSDYSSGAQMQYGTQPQYQAQGRGMGSMTSGDIDNPRAVAITDEYGNKYNSRGERIGHGGPMRAQQ